MYHTTEELGEAWERVRGLVTGDGTSPAPCPAQRGLETLRPLPKRSDGVGLANGCSSGLLLPKDAAPGEGGLWSANLKLLWVRRPFIGSLQPCELGARWGHEPGAVAGTPCLAGTAAKGRRGEESWGKKTSAPRCWTRCYGHADPRPHATG